MVWRLSFSQAIYQFVVQEQLKTHDEVRAKLEGEVVVIDLLNQALNFGNGHDAVRRAAGKRIVSMVLAGARPCVVLDGRCGAPGSGKPSRDKAEARARTVNVNVPGAEDPAFYEAGSVWFSRTALDDGHGGYGRLMDLLRGDCQTMGVRASVALVRDKDAHAYGCALACCCLTSTQDASVHFYEFTDHEDLLAGLRLQSEDDVRALVWFFGANDQIAPAERYIEATAPWATKAKADDASGRGDGTEVSKIMRHRERVTKQVVGFIGRVSALARAANLDGALAAIRRLVALERNDTRFCSTHDYKRYLAPAFGDFGSSDRNALRLFLDAYDDEMRHGGAYGLLGPNARPTTLRDARQRIRESPYPQGFVRAATALDAYRWLSSQFGGGLLPPQGHPKFRDTLEKVRLAWERAQ